MLFVLCWITFICKRPDPWIGPFTCIDSGNRFLYELLVVSSVILYDDVTYFG